ncbi:thiol:disulfide interchange protein DsbA/DsbL [Undibacterium sp. 14-3-2]|uniref:thiol:disulfide interchange protein DsbA/DsbL n=1 Tax=Undibacterium sp. 14-3-2 TaxID=2800129 RepID=UPI0019066F84|nr:thiol:disulfide interchange protein DsbA/DsbL [Undibacterium sp. 14-3-2]MBK1890384.1 thiol:disulfide interchange protein DsbA/DsbL [Undibacterium sp. 14-3-2]
MRRFTQAIYAVFLLGLGLVSAGAGASPAMPQSGVEYRVLGRPQPTEAGKKVEVIEFFGYFCPHCNALEPLIAEWVKKQGDNIVFKRVHVNFHNLVQQQKLYLTLEAMGKADEYQIKAFNALHVERNRLQSDAEVMSFVAKSGLDKQKFTDVYNSFAIQSKLNRTNQLLESYQVDSVPMVAVDGRFLTSPVESVRTMGRVSEDTQNRSLLQVLDFLVSKAQKEKAVAAPAAAADSGKKK